MPEDSPRVSERQAYRLRCQLEPAHQSDVKAVLAISDDLIVTASRDTSVGLWKMMDGLQFELKALLEGHHAYVNSLAYIPSESSGLDDGQWCSEALLDGHQEAVWGVAIVDAGPREGCYLTADNMINLWDKEGNILSRLKGSPAPVRSLTVMQDHETFVSACNDNLIRLWNFDGEVLQLLKAHRDYVYQVTLSNANDGSLLSCSEDHTDLRLMQADGEAVAQLLHPCQTVWSVSSLPNGDVVTGGSDGRVRIWSADESRHMSQEQQDVYITAVEKAMKAYNDDLNTQSRSNNPDASTITIDIDISDAEPPIPLVLQAGADPRQAAVDFGGRHGLSDNYIDQIEAFIIANLQAQR
ncbi:hypothetical protein IAU59_000405 [Kwoniella sp. CBS 9459]